MLPCVILPKRKRKKNNTLCSERNAAMPIKYTFEISCKAEISSLMSLSKPSCRVRLTL